MPAPLAKGLIIAASVLVAAGLALYESPQVRHWVDQSRRKIAVALHNLGDEIHPRSPDGQSQSQPCSPSREAEDERRRRRQESIRRSRAELIRKAREDGVAVDLDELARLGTELHELQHPARPGAKTADRNRSFDQLVGDDGKLKPEDEKKQEAAVATGAEGPEQSQLRFRSRGLDGLHQGSVYANPFADDEAQVLFDRHLIGVDDDDAHSQNMSAQQTLHSRQTTVTLEADDSASSTTSQHLIDLSAPSSQIETYQTASIHSIPSQASLIEESVAPSVEASQSFHSLHSSPSTPIRSRSNTLTLFTPGDVTPTDDGFSSSASVVGSHADDIARLTESLHSGQHSDDDDALSEAFSEIGAGQSTPGSWTDVDSDGGSEFGGMH